MAQTDVERAVPTTAEGIYIEAVRHWGSTSFDVAIVTVIDGRNDNENTICAEVDNLGWAIARENGIKDGRDTYPEITALLNARRDRRFRLQNPEALASLLNVNEEGLDFDKELCGYVRRNVYAFRGDRAPQLYVGQLHN